MTSEHIRASSQASLYAHEQLPQLWHSELMGPQCLTSIGLVGFTRVISFASASNSSPKLIFKPEALSAMSSVTCWYCLSRAFSLSIKHDHLVKHSLSHTEVTNGKECSAHRARMACCRQQLSLDSRYPKAHAVFQRLAVGAAAIRRPHRRQSRIQGDTFVLGLAWITKEYNRASDSIVCADASGPDVLMLMWAEIMFVIKSCVHRDRVMYTGCKEPAGASMQQTPSQSPSVGHFQCGLLTLAFADSSSQIWICAQDPRLYMLVT